MCCDLRRLAFIALFVSTVAHAQEPAVGAVEVDVDPAGQEVLLDGQHVGKTPLRIDTVSAGAHRIEVVDVKGTKSGWDVVVQAGITVKLGDRKPATPATPTAPTTPKPRVPSTATRVAALVAVGVALASMLAAGVLWSSSPRHIPVIGRVPTGVTEEQVLGVSALFLVVAAVAALVAVT